MFLQIVADQEENLLDEAIEIEQSSGPKVLFKARPNAFDHRIRAKAVSGDLAEFRLRFIDIGYRTIKPPATSIGPGYHCG